MSTSTVPPPSADASCPVCRDEAAGALAAVKGCMHKFCEPCIQKWAKVCVAPNCPLCKISLQVIILPDGSEQTLEIGTEVPKDEAPDFSGLDHQYFHSETSRLLRRAQAVHDRLVVDTFGTARRRSGGGGGSSGEGERALDIMAGLLAALQNYRQMMVEEVPFEAHAVLQALHQLDHLTSLLQSGQPVPSDALEAIPGIVLTADGWHDCAADYHDDWAEDDYYFGDYGDYDDGDGSYNDRGDTMAAGLHRTRGRRPTTRKKIGRR